jgi:hypothetical protein
VTLQIPGTELWAMLTHAPESLMGFVIASPVAASSRRSNIITWNIRSANVRASTSLGNNVGSPVSTKHERPAPDVQASLRFTLVGA